jgi:hypothetical protein
MCVFTCHKLCARCLSRASRHSECNKNIVMSQSTEGKLRGSRSFIFHYFYLRFAGVFAYLSLLPPHCVCRWWPKLFLSNFRQESRECAHRAAPEVGINYLPWQFVFSPLLLTREQQSRGESTGSLCTWNILSMYAPQRAVLHYGGETMRYYLKSGAFRNIYQFSRRKNWRSSASHYQSKIRQAVKL